MWMTRSASCVSLLALLAVSTATSATSTSTEPDTTGPQESERLVYQLENVNDGESVTVSESAELIVAEPTDEEPPTLPNACYNDAVDCANKMKDQCLNRGGVKKVTFESTIEKCSATCNNGDVINCTKTQWPKT